MPKPDWLIENERKSNRPEPITCDSCRFFQGVFIRYTKYKNEKKCEIWECAKHKGCLNTKYSIRCPDHEESIV